MRWLIGALASQLRPGPPRNDSAAEAGPAVVEAALGHPQGSAALGGENNSTAGVGRAATPPELAAPSTGPVPHALVSAEPATEPAPDPAIAEAMAYDYTLQYVGVDQQMATPRSPNDPLANRCLASLAGDDVGGMGLGYAGCAHYSKTDDRGRPLGEASTPSPDILFNFFLDGRIRNKLTGLCLRRVLCGDSFIYDLGPCEEQTAVKFSVWKSNFGRLDNLGFLGPPLQGLKTACSMCGPFVLKQKCGTPETSVSCGTRQVPPGWTKKRTMLRPKYEKLDQYTLAFSPSPRSLCGTMVQETAPRDPLDLSAGDPPPWYFFHRYKDGKGSAMAR